MDQCPIMVKVLGLGEIALSEFPYGLFPWGRRVDLTGQDTELNQFMKRFGQDACGMRNPVKLTVARSLLTNMRLRVKVPVLSTHKTVAEPRVSIAGTRR